MYGLGESYPLDFYIAGCFLHMTEQSLGSREGDCHRAQLAQDPVPFITTNTLPSTGYGGEDIPEAVLPVWGQGQHHVDGV